MEVVHEGPIWPMGYDESEPRWTHRYQPCAAQCCAWNHHEEGQQVLNVPLRCPVDLSPVKNHV